MNTMVIGAVYAVVGVLYHFFFAKKENHSSNIATAYSAFVNVISWPIPFGVSLFQASMVIGSSLLYLFLGKVGFEFMKTAFQEAKAIVVNDVVKKNESSKKMLDLMKSNMSLSVRFIGLIQAISFMFVGTIVSAVMLLPYAVLRTPLRSMSK